MGIRNMSNIRMNVISGVSVTSTESLESDELVQRYLELNGLIGKNNDVKIIRKGAKTGVAMSSPPAALDPNAAAIAATLANAGSSDFGNEIFATDLQVANEALRQMLLIAEEIGKSGRTGGYNLMHMLRCITDATTAGTLLTVDNRNIVFDIYPNTIESGKTLLMDLNNGGYMDIVKKRQKYHDYKANANAYSIWDSVLLHQGQASKTNGGYHTTKAEHYLIPFDADIYLRKAATGNPADLKTTIQSFHMIPYRDSFISVMGDNSNVDLLDLRDFDLDASEITSKHHTNLGAYIGAPKLSEKMVEFYALGTKGKAERVKPRYKLDDTVVFQGRNGQHYQAPEQFLAYLYNNYFGEELDIDVVESPNIVAPHLTPKTNNYYYGGYNSRNQQQPAFQNFIFSVKRRGSIRPLVLYRTQHDLNDMKVITR